MTSRNNRTITSSLQQRITHHCEVQAHSSKTNTTSRNDHHQEPIKTNIINMHETNLQEKGAKISR